MRGGEREIETAEMKRSGESQEEWQKKTTKEDNSSMTDFFFFHSFTHACLHERERDKGESEREEKRK